MTHAERGVGGVRPVTPVEARDARQTHIPDAAIAAFNELIQNNLRNGVATVLEDAVVQRMIENGLSKNDIYQKGWLNVENLFEAYGWEVQYEKSGYNESGPASFTFRALS